MRWTSILLLFLSAGSASAQESQFQADLRREGETVKKNCADLTFKSIGSCAYTLITDHPFHLALGNLAPQNGFAFGVAFVEHYTPNERWRFSWNVDGVRAASGSWRTGGYMKIIRTPDTPGIVVVTSGVKPGANAIVIREYPVWNIYGQVTSLEKLFFFGSGPATAASGRSVFRERQALIGTNAIIPLTRPAAIQGIRPSFVGAVNGRFVRVQGNTSEAVPSIDQLYPTTPGLGQQTTFVQFQEGVRLKPSIAAGRLRLNYLVDFSQFVAAADSHLSFHRWSVDLDHEIPLYRNVSSPGPRDTNGPDECFQAVGSTACPPVSFSRNREGTVSFRFLTTSSTASAGHKVPFYFQPTLGGSDINGERLLSSYDDYRFRAPHLIALQESLEHSLFSWPVGVWVLAEQGKVVTERGDLNFGDLKHSYAVGLTFRAGGFPVVNLSFAWGGNEGHHIIGSMDSSLLGGSGRPSWY